MTTLRANSQQSPCALGSIVEYLSTKIANRSEPVSCPLYLLSLIESSNSAPYGKSSLTPSSLLVLWEPRVEWHSLRRELSQSLPLYMPGHSPPLPACYGAELLRHEVPKARVDWRV
jgi:hypothetical protein